jgi:hypothetical protein
MLWSPIKLSGSIPGSFSTKQHTLANIWEARFELSILKFQCCLLVEEFLVWVASVDEILNFNDVHNDMRVSLVVTKFRERAIAKWLQLKQSKMHQGKTKVNN